MDARRQRATTLDLSHLLGERIPPELFELEWLESLIIRRDDTSGRKALTRLPSDFKRLKALRTLDIAWHSIGDLSPLKGLTQLQWLDCIGNQVTDLSPLEGLIRLKGLYCDFNYVYDLSPLKSLTQLQWLSCLCNQVANLEPVRPAICSGQIEEFYCYGNPIHGLPAELLRSGLLDSIAKELRGYWRELEQGSEPNRDVKVMLVGNGCVGKTTLAYSLLHGHPPPTGINERTHGIVTKELPLELPIGEMLRARLWDCGGQELYHATHRLFLHHDALYLLLWAEETDEAPEEPRHPVSYWLAV